MQSFKGAPCRALVEFCVELWWSSMQSFKGALHGAPLKALLEALPKTLYKALPEPLHKALSEVLYKAPSKLYIELC